MKKTLARSRTALGFGASRTASKETASKETAAQDTVARIYAVVRSIPRGRVATYGELAALAGVPGGHRLAARAMRSCPDSLPWHRVVGKKDARRGQIKIEHPEHAAFQRALLEAESVVFDSGGFILLQQAGWLASPARRARPRLPRRPSTVKSAGHPSAVKNQRRSKTAKKRR